MNLNKHKFLHYLLITLLMFAPIRGAIAVQQTHCDMHDMTMESSSAMLMESHDMSDMSLIDAQCCCCDGADCASNCDMGMTVSVIMQPSSYQPVFKNVAESIILSANVLVRELTPPSRPPANLHK